ncbi:MAG: ADP-ribosyltransferase [Chitinophagaceae bacterium]
MTRQEKIDNLKTDIKQNYGLLQDEANALVMFKASDCIGLNSKIRRNSLTPEEIVFCNNLKNGLLKIPSTSEKVIYRHLNFIDFQIENVKNYFENNLGKRIRFQEFQSCTLRHCFTGNSNHHNWSMKISTNEPTNAKEIFSLWDKHELNDSEQEILLLNNTCFEVMSVTPDSNIKVHLIEIQSHLQIESVPEF